MDNLTANVILEGTSFILNGTSLKCLENEGEQDLFEMFSGYFYGLTWIGFLWIGYTAGTYLFAIYLWWSGNDNSIKKILLPLQIYMRDIDQIIDTMKNNVNDNQQGINRVQHLKSIKKKYDRFIQAETFCWIKSERKGKNDYELCLYKKRDDTFIDILREVDGGYCQVNKKALPLKVSSSNVFYGRYKPYFIVTSLTTVNLNLGLGKKRHIKVDGLDDSCYRFWCGWWSLRPLKLLELSIRFELDEEVLKSNINFYKDIKTDDIKTDYVVNKKLDF
jgi:hypothetical protein